MLDLPCLHSHRLFNIPQHKNISSHTGLPSIYLLLTLPHLTDLLHLTELLSSTILFSSLEFSHISFLHSLFFIFKDVCTLVFSSNIFLHLDIGISCKVLVPFYVVILTLSSKSNCNCHKLHAANMSPVDSAQECDVGMFSPAKGGVFKMITHVVTLLHFN